MSRVRERRRRGHVPTECLLVCSQKLYKVVHGDLVVLAVQERDARCEMRDARCEMLVQVSDKRYKIMTLVSWPSPASSRFPSAPSSSTPTNCFYLLEYRLWLCCFARPFNRLSDLSNLALSSLFSILPFRLAAYSTFPSQHLTPPPVMLHQIVMPCVESEGA